MRNLVKRKHRRKSYDDWSYLHIDEPEFWRRTKKHGTCLQYLDHADGYLQVRLTYADGYKLRRIHQIAYALSRGLSELPQDQVIRHTCHNAWCCNPFHLTLGTPEQNTLAKHTQHLSLIHI